MYLELKNNDDYFHNYQQDYMDIELIVSVWIMIY